MVLLVCTTQDNSGQDNAGQDNAGQDNSDLWRKCFEHALPEKDIRIFPNLGKSEEIDFMAIWGTPPKELSQCTHIKAIFTLSAGVDHVLESQTIADLLVPIFRLEDAGMAEQMGQYALYAALTLQRDFDLYHQAIAKGKWPAYPLRPTSSFRIGIMGAGTLGKKVAQILQSYGFDVSVWRRHQSPVEGIETFFGPLEPFLASLDLVVAILPQTPDTTHLINKKTLASLPKNSGFANLGRGNLVDEQALLNHLDAGKLRHAFLDVFAEEPLAKDHPFRNHPRVTVTPHISATTLPEMAVEQIAKKIRQIENGQVPSGQVSYKRRY